MMNGQNPTFIPGPTNMPDRLRFKMAMQTYDHRAPDFVEVLHPVLEDLKKVFKTANGRVVTFPASGSGGWEAALSNTLSPGDKVLASRYGMFSQKWIAMCNKLGLEVEVIEAEWGTGAPAEEIGRRLAADADHRIKAVLSTHNETATGVRSDIAAVRNAIDRNAIDGASHPAMLYVDCVSSLGSMDFRMDEWGVDLAVTGSQKGFMLPTGLAIVAFSEKAQTAVETAGLPRAFFDFREMCANNDKSGYPYTPPVQLVYALRESLDMLLEEGLDNVFARHHRIAEGVRAAVRAWGFELCARTPNLYSDTVSAIFVPESFDADALVNHAFDAYGMSFGVGLGEMAGKAFRIGHLGIMTDAMALSGLATIEMAMKDLDYPIELGSGVAAAQEYYRTNRD